MTDNSTQVLICAAVVWLGFYGAAVRHVWKIYRIRHAQFNFYITDLWAGILGLLPTYICIRVLPVYFAASVPQTVFMGITMFLFEILGMAYGLMMLKIQQTNLHPRGVQAFMVVNGGLIGFGANLSALMISFFIGAMLVLSPSVLAGAAFLFMIVLFPFILAWAFRKKR